MSSRGNNRKGFHSNKRRHPQNIHSRGKKFNPNINNQKEFLLTKQLTEAEVGITEYVSEHEGFSGVIKARFSDFHVSEIDLNGEIAVLTNTDIPKETRKKIDFNTIEQSPCELLPQNVWDEIKELMNNKSKEIVQFEVTDVSKEDRKQMYLKLREIFGNKLIADTSCENEKKIISFKRPTCGRGADRTDQWPENRGDYVHFLVYKESIDTMNACYQIAEALRIKPSHFTYAGIKDKRAKTTQWFSAKRVEPWKLIIKTKYIRHMKIGNITFKDTPLKLGDLSGNRFKIAIKNIVCENSVIEKAVNLVKEHGFINYYGLQRFGNDKEVPTYSIGLQLLQGNWKEACDLILKPKESDDFELDISRAKKTFLDSGNAGEAYKCLYKNKNCVEAKLLEGLAKGQKNEYVNALESIPRNMRLLYIHAFQSLIWNTMVSKRIKKYGLKPVENDFVIVNNVYIEPDMDPTEDNEENSENSDENVKMTSETPRPQVKSLTKTDLTNYTIFDIVLPLPGYDIQYPENMKNDYREELEKYGLTLEMPQQSVKTYSLSGTYRKIFGQAKDLEWKIIKYNDPNDSLILSDFDKLRKFEAPTDIPDGKYKALIIEVSLDSSSYATMALRELMKIDTSPSAQVKLNGYGSSKNKKISLTNDGSEDKFETIDANTSGSLLNDEQKMEEFKKNIFAEIVCKRKVEEDDDVKKKLKTDDE
ncbi:hypothetical protein HHI36_004073 [Cryptolaemus montrouzieri]|uniref:TRUD domain-containing protein n=1 Tax=Cryptolaemus montrouzieri TaxID=559131 RepID=A0ABD2NQE5_9CUCU